MSNKLLIGRSEWCSLPDFKIPAIKAKIDTGAKTSAIHAFNIKTGKKNGENYVSFDIHPVQQNDEIIVSCTKLILDERSVMSSNGVKERRYVIATQLIMGEQQWEIEVTLSNRDPLRYRLLLGREALRNHVLIDPSMTCHQGKRSRKSVLALYNC